MGYFNQVCVIGLFLLLAMRHGLGSPAFGDALREEIARELMEERNELQERRMDERTAPDSDSIDIFDLAQMLARLRLKAQQGNPSRRSNWSL